MFKLYFICLTFGVVYSIFYAIFGSHGVEGHGGDIHVDTHSADTHEGPSIFSPVVLASALSAFGGAGLVGDKGFGFGTIFTLLFALSISLCIGTAVFYGVVKVLYNSQSDSNFSEEDLRDIEAEVIIPIPEKGLGEIAFVAGGTRTTMPAHSTENTAIDNGTVVMIRNIENKIAYVSKKIIIDDLINEEEKNKKRGRIN